MLSEREIEVLKMLSFGYTNDKIAQILYISKHTVKAHLEKIYEKLNVHNRLQAVIYAVQHNMLENFDYASQNYQNNE